MSNPQVLESKDSNLEETVSRVIRESGEPEKIDVIARGGDVHLVGSVRRLEAKRKIGALVESIPGVLMVINHLHVIAWEEKRGPGHF